MRAPGAASDGQSTSRSECLERVKWLVPMTFAMFGFYVQSVCLHYATYSYVHKYAMDPGTPPGANEYAVLADPVEEYLGEEKISIGILDLIAGFFPACFFALSVLIGLGEVSISDTGELQLTRIPASTSNSPWKDRRNTGMRNNTLQLWTKVMMCAGFLFILKGIIGAVTTVPDSSGWEVCKARLKPEGVQWMREEHTFFSMMLVDFEWNVLWYHHPLRYCSDMLFSGHTFVVTLFGLGLYELVRILRPTHFRSWPAALVKMVTLTALAALAVGEQAMEIYAVEKSRFHYTSDIILALVMTFLLYTNSVVAMAGKRWCQLEPGPVLDQAKEMLMLKGRRGSDANARVWNDVEDAAERQSATVHAQVANILDEHREKWDHLNSGGDIFVPPCCVPCCCYAGRRHIYSDGQIKDILDTFFFADEHHPDAGSVTSVSSMIWNPLATYFGSEGSAEDRVAPEQLRAALAEHLSEQMGFSEGVSLHQFEDLLGAGSGSSSTAPTTTGLP